MTTRSDEHVFMEAIKRNKWALGYLMVLTTAGFILQIAEVVKR